MFLGVEKNRSNLNNQNMNQEIINAIENYNLIEFSYNGHYRIVEPHTYGINHKGNDMLAAYQIDGTSDKGDVPDWKQFNTDKISGLKILEDNFTGTRIGYKKGDSGMDVIYAEL